MRLRMLELKQHRAAACWLRAHLRDTFGKAPEEIKMTLVKSTFVMIVCLLLSVGCLAQDKNTGAIKGKVHVEQGSPSGVAVILLQGEHEVTRVSTDKKGEFVISRVPAGVYSLKFRKPGLAVGTIDPLEVHAGKTRTLGDRLVLSVDEGSIAFVRGSVFTEAGRSVPGVRVELAKIINESSLQKIDSRVTSETGEFVFRLPPETAKYRVTAKADGAQTVSKDVDVDGAAVFRVALTLKPLPK